MRSSLPTQPTAPTAPRSPCLELYHLPHVTRTRLDSGSVLRVSDPENTAVCVESGALAIEILDAQQGTSIIEVLGTGSCCSDVSRSGVTTRTKSALVALVPTSVLVLPMNVLLDHIVSNTELAGQFFKGWSARYRAWAERLTLLRARSPLRRTAGTLLYLAEQMGQQCPLAPGRRILLTQDVIARIADLSRQTLNRELQRMQASRIIRLGRSMVCVLNLHELQQVFDGDLVPRGGLTPVPCQLLNPSDPLECFPVVTQAR